MKKTLLILICGHLIACNSFGKVKVSKDEFKGSTVVEMTLRHSSTEDFGLYSRNIGEVTYLREVLNDKATSFKLMIKSGYLPIEGGFNLDENGFLKIGEAQIAIKLSNRTNHSKSETSSKGKKKDDDEVETTTVNFASAEVNLDPKSLDQLAAANAVAIRIYYKSKAITYTFDEDDIAKLHAFLGAK